MNESLKIMLLTVLTVLFFGFIGRILEADKGTLAFGLVCYLFVENLFKGTGK